MPNIFQAKTFNFTRYRFSAKEKAVHFFYQINFTQGKPLVFQETIFLPKNPNFQKIPRAFFNHLLENIHLILGLSYYKTYLPPEIILKQTLTKEQADFFNLIYEKGLGEFLYKNKLSKKLIAKFPYTRNKLIRENYVLNNQKTALVGIGGGKDSLVTLELLKKSRLKFQNLVIENQQKNPIIDRLTAISQIKTVKIRRRLDPKLFQTLPNSYNGHIPISAIYAFLGILSATLTDASCFIVSNEYSSNWGNLSYEDEIINHQWSKSFEFEQAFNTYLHRFLTPSLGYFSLLRPFFEIKIAQLFGKSPQYFPYFTSCNQSFKLQKKNHSLWCKTCPKCVFVFTMLAPFLPKKELLKIFQDNLFENPNLKNLFRDLLGFGKLKPFECVGTPLEMQSAFSLAQKKYQNSFIFKTFLPKIRLTKKEILACFLKYNSLNIALPYSLALENKILILGYGQEGKITHKYLEKYFPFLNITIADQTQGKNYLNKQKNFDFIIKTPSIPKNLVKKNYTTATNLFFSHINPNQIIAVTGSKGKSTTSSLIYHILKQAGFSVKLLGNIGKPMLQALLKPINPKTLFVLELSSYQLDDLKFSPHISILTSLFPEHLDYHQNLHNYFSAKANLVKFAQKNDFFISHKQEKTDLFETQAQKIHPLQKLPFSLNKVNLLGKHNLNNIKLAYNVAKIFKIKDKIIQKALETFQGLPHRLQKIGTFNNITFYDDAISTTPESTIAAINSLKQIDTLILGGLNRGYNFTELAETILHHKIKNLIFFPESGKIIWETIKKQLKKQNKSLDFFNNIYFPEITKKELKFTKNSLSNFNPPTQKYLKTLPKNKLFMALAIKKAFTCTKPNKICLLSCASPSYSLWKNFEEKGNLFQFFIKKLK